MFRSVMAAGLLVLPVQAQDDSLSPADREALLESLEKLQASANERVDARFLMAINAYRSAMSSDTAAMELYMKCVEKVDFEDQKRKSSDFREWKRKEADNLSKPGFRKALRYQLSWLVLTLQAASSNPDRTKLASDAQQILDSIFSDAASLKDHHQILRQGVTGSIFARAYDIQGVKLERWPLAPLQLEAVYNQILLPPSRKAGRTDSLRAGWTRRIQQEGLMHEHWVRDRNNRNEQQNNRIGTKEALRPPEYEKFLADTLPELQWDMEVDIYRHGDQRGAALRMLAHIEKHLTHSKSRDWASQFQQLLTPEEPPAPTVPTTTAGANP